MVGFSTFHDLSKVRMKLGLILAESAKPLNLEFK